MKKLLALMVGFLLVGLAFGLAQEKAQEQAQAKTALKAQGQTQQNKVQAKSEFRHRNRVASVDENGADFSQRVPGLTLTGPTGVSGRSAVIHQGWNGPLDAVPDVPNDRVACGVFGDVLPLPTFFF